MQHKQETIIQKCKLILIGTTWVAGLLIAGSDSPYMPWTNGMGLLLFLSASIFLSRQMRPLQSNQSYRSSQVSGSTAKSSLVRMSFRKIDPKPGRINLPNVKSNQRMKVKYAL